MIVLEMIVLVEVVRLKWLLSLLNQFSSLIVLIFVNVKKVDSKS